MEAELADGDVVLVDQVRYHFGEPGRFDVIVFDMENNGADRTYVKRIIGLPGERIQIINETVYVNGAPLAASEELTHVALSGLAEEEIVLGPDEYFVLGDNRESSEDSRFPNIRNVKRSQIRGCVWFRVAPFKDLGLIRYQPE